MRKLLLVAYSLLITAWSPGLAQVREQPPDSLDHFIEAKMEERQIPGLALAIAYVLKVPEKWSEITVRHLLTHTSGLPLRTTWSPPIDISREMWFEAAAEDPLEFEPGQGFQYSDPGYTLLGFITEEVTGTPSPTSSTW